MCGQSSSLLGWYPDKLAAQLAACSGQRIPSSGAFHTYFKWYSNGPSSSCGTGRMAQHATNHPGKHCD